MAKKPKYSHVTKISDITIINDKIRSEIRKAKTRKRLTELLSQSRYLYTLSHQKHWKENFRGQLTALRTRIRNQFTKTARLANEQALKIGTRADYDTKID